MALDLYQRLGVQRGASEAEIKKAYRSSPRSFIPIATRTIRRPPSASSKVTAGL